VLIPNWCWQPIEFWFHPEIVISPYWVFVTAFSISSLGAIFEFIYLAKKQCLSIFIGSVLFSILALSVSCLAVQYTNWQTLKIMKGELTYEDYWYKYYDEDVVQRIRGFREHKLRDITWPSEIPEYSVYKLNNSCGSGIEIWNVDPRIWEEYDQLWYKYDLNKNIETVRENLYRMYDLE
jgi:hypothetical protein